MRRIKLCEEHRGQAEVTYTKRSALYADKCTGCGLVFRMDSWCNDTGLAVLNGTFESERMVCDAEGRGLGNMFRASVCSFGCADDVFTGGWLDIEEYRSFADADATLVRGELKITTRVKGETALVEEWEQAKEYDAPSSSHTYFTGPLTINAGHDPLVPIPPPVPSLSADDYDFHIMTTNEVGPNFILKPPDGEGWRYIAPMGSNILWARAKQK